MKTCFAFNISFMSTFFGSPSLFKYAEAESRSTNRHKDNKIWQKLQRSVVDRVYMKYSDMIGEPKENKCQKNGDDPSYVHA